MHRMQTTPSQNPTTRPHTLSRRRFSRALATSAVGWLGAPALLRGRDLNGRLNVAVIGVGGRGAGNLAEVGATENIVAVCDVAESAVNAAVAKHPNARRFADFRRLFDIEKQFDAVVVSTCEHTHAFATLPALRLRKHVYCEKPLSYNVWEARIIRQAAATARVATQMGTQIHATDNYRRVVELVQAGAIGPVREAHVWVGRAWGRQDPEAARRNNDIVSVRERPEGSSPVPTGLDWDLWIGPAPFRPFHEVYYPGPKWYRWWDFGNGTMSDLGSHWNDLPFWALKLDAPLTIEAGGPPPHPEIAPASMHAVYEYGARGTLPPVRLTWHQGEDRPQIWKDGGIPRWDSGVLFVGSQGRMLIADYSRHQLLPEKDFVGFTAPPQSIPKSIGHHQEWIRACKTGEPTTCNFGYAGLLTEANHLGNVAYRVGRKLEWDSAGLRVRNAAEAAPLIRREYRKGWTLV
ncbi:MAG: Gfo/Idh/MocA family oxidoreductase [Verrucomicrobia bacterium]|nr:MAG: Gfo/Idh/MocA family oxidoreductase [Verrucomicrobiota bacterium]